MVYAIAYSRIFHIYIETLAATTICVWFKNGGWTRIQQTNWLCSCICWAQLQKSQTILEKSIFCKEFESAQSTNSVITLGIGFSTELSCMPIWRGSDREPVCYRGTNSGGVLTILIVYHNVKGSDLLLDHSVVLPDTLFARAAAKPRTSAPLLTKDLTSVYL